MVVMPPLVALDVEALEQVAFPPTEQRGILRRVEVFEFHEPKRRGTLAQEAVFEFVPAPFLPFPTAGIAAQVAAGEAGDEEARVAQRSVAADLPVIEVLNVFLVEENFQVAVESSAEIGLQFRAKPGYHGSHRFAGSVVALMRVGDEDVVVHGICQVIPGMARLASASSSSRRW